MKVRSEAALLVDMDTDVVLYEHKADDKIVPASITKVMTALLVLEAIERGDLTMKEKVKAYDDCWTGLDSTSSNQNIRPGEKMSVEDLLYCMLVASANEACNILGERVSGSIDDFVSQMNVRAEELGCTGTHFENTHGMPERKHYTTCRDLYLITKAAMGYSQFREIVKTDEYYVKKTNVSPQRHFFNTNALLSNMKYRGYVYSPCIGIKTGTTEKGGHNLLSAAELDGRTLVSVVIGCQTKPKKDGTLEYTHFSESSRLLQWGFDNFTTINIVDQKKTYGEVPVTLSTDVDSVAVAPERSISAELPKDITPESFEMVPSLRSSVEAPVHKGEVLGTLVLYLDGKEYGAVNLLAVNDVEASAFLKRKAFLEEFFSRWYVKAAIGLLAVLVLLVVLRLTVFRRSRRYGSRHYGRSGGYRGRRRW
jgi:D-alanyl-D-alanine carboxypeptidase (penicillin-binding protein 5/6)